MRPMTRHKHTHTGLVTPQLPQLLLTAVLRAFAMLVLNVASTLQMICRRGPVIGTQAMPSALPQAKTDTQSQETTPAAQHDSPQSAHAEQARFASRPSKHERVLTTASSLTTCHPGNAQRCPGTIVRARQWMNGSRLSLRSTGMTTVGSSQQSELPPLRVMRLLNQLATNKNAAA